MAPGTIVQFALTEGQTHEMKAADSLLAEVADAFVVGERAYDATSLREQLKKQGCQVVMLKSHAEGAAMVPLPS